ncbi:MAG: hypothetical protein JO240_04515 [Solirubrobacterales bacterium]|nr:hypothetical protein [Solirubrobacterales bacterium]
MPLSHAQTLCEAARQPKRLEVFAGLGHNDLLSARERYVQVVKRWIGDQDGRATPGAGG